MRVFIGLNEVAGYYGNLAQGLRELGVDADFVSFTNHPFQYRHAHAPSRFARVVSGVSRRRGKSLGAHSVLRTFWGAVDIATRVLFFGSVCLRYDAFIFGFNSTFFSYRELPLLRRLGKQIVYVYNGSDSRPTYLDGSEMARDRALTIRQCIDRTRTKKETLSTIERYATAIVANPLSAQLHEKPFVSFLLTGIPYPLPEEVSARPEGPVTAPVRILHSPSHPEAKGTPAIREIVDRLRAKGCEIDFVEVIGRPNQEVLEELARCDLVIDQLYSDQPVAGFAAEAAGFARPAVVGGYGLDVFRNVMPAGRMIPVCYRHPQDVEAALEALVRDKAARTDLGDSARAFIEAYWSPKAVARNYMDILEGTIPDEWIYDPAEISYFRGACMPENRAREIVAAVIEQGGVEALQVSDKPRLQRELVEFARAGSAAVSPDA